MYLFLNSLSVVSESLMEHLTLWVVTDHHGPALSSLLDGNPSVVEAQSESPSHTSPGQTRRDGACALLNRG